MNIRRVIVILISVALLAPFSACERNGGAEDVPAQVFATLPDALGQDTGSLTGKVVFPSEYSQRSVSIRIDNNTFVTHPDGRFLVTRIPAGAHRLAVLVNGFEPIEHQVAIAPDEVRVTEALKLRLARGTVIGRLVFLDGNSAAALPIRLDPMGGQTRTDGDGIFEFVGVSAGAHKLLIEDKRFYTKSLTVELQANETRNLGIVNVFRRAGVENAALTPKRRDIR